MAVSNLGQILDRLQAWHPYPRAMLVYVDIRHMRSINQLAAPSGGDAVIRDVLQVLSEWAGEQGVADRVWSNEFVAAKAVDNGQTAIEETADLRERLGRVRYASAIGENSVAVSLGLVVTHDDGRWAAHVAHAAEACVAAKKRGLNQIVSYASLGRAAADAAIDAGHVREFRRLRDEGLLLLDPQPVMDIRGARPRLAKAEFLLRRIGADGSHHTLPVSMIETMEYFGLSTELDAFSVHYVLSWAATHQDILERLDGITLNLSARTLVDGRFMNRLYQDARSLGLPHGKLGFEITETAAIQHLDLAADLIRDFHQIGCTFSLDDFGSGLSSFGYLHSLPVDEVKIDGRFIHDIAANQVSQEIVRAIQQIAQATGKRTIAEFVDHPDKLTTLQTLGIDYAQGWLFYPALPTERLIALLADAPVSARRQAASSR
ncbi:EAL domain-containing protein [Fontimonas sp. SYSU GA230001]|uniref:EAL domain-containing protein n=1 Tax=Fontimonas sp. SYSU GA230001 TaxID=3142450 RepID=UPI0032B3F14A